MMFPRDKHLGNTPTSLISSVRLMPLVAIKRQLGEDAPLAIAKSYDSYKQHLGKMKKWESPAV